MKMIWSLGWGLIWFLWVAEKMPRIYAGSEVHIWWINFGKRGISGFDLANDISWSRALTILDHKMGLQKISYVANDLDNPNA